MPDYGNINEPGARVQFPNLPHPTKNPGAVTPRLKKERNMDTNTKKSGQVKRLVLDNAEVTK